MAKSPIDELIDAIADAIAAIDVGDLNINPRMKPRRAGRKVRDLDHPVRQREWRDEQCRKISLTNDPGRKGFIILDHNFIEFADDGLGRGVLVFPEELSEEMGDASFLLTLQIQVMPGLPAALRARGMEGKGPVRIWVGRFHAGDGRFRCTGAKPKRSDRTFGKKSHCVAVEGVSLEAFLQLVHILAKAFDQPSVLVKFEADIEGKERFVAGVEITTIGPAGEVGDDEQ